MKKTLCFMLSTLLILAVCALPALAAEATPEFIIAATTPDAEGNFQLTVSVTGGTFSVGLYAIQYDPAKVQLMDGDVPAVSTDTDAGKYFHATGCSLMAPVADVEAGRAMTAFFQIGGVDARENAVTLATLDFKLQSGVTTGQFNAATFSYITDGEYIAEYHNTNEPMMLIDSEDSTVWGLLEDPKLELTFDYPNATVPAPPIQTERPPTTGPGTPTPPTLPPTAETTPPVIVTPEPVETPTPEIPVFDDLDPSDWYYDNIIRLVTNGIISGDEGRATVRPLDNITRQEVAVVLVNALKLPLDSEGSLLTGDPSADWAVEYLLAAREYGIMLGDDRGFMNGNGLARRSEVVTMVARAIGLDPEDADISVISGFADFDTIEDWAVPYAALMVQNGYLMGYEDNTLRLSNHILRCETFALVDRILFG